MVFSDVLGQEMTKRQISAYGLSQLSGIPESTIRNYKNNVSPSIKTAEVLLNALGLKLEVKEIEP